MKSILFIISFATFCCSQAKTFTSVSSGKWTSSQTWDISESPADGDTVIINSSDTVFLNTAYGACKELHLYGVLFLNSSSNQLDCEQLLTFQQASINGKSTGAINCNTLINFNNLQLGAFNLNAKSITNYGYLNISSQTGTKETDTLFNYQKILITDRESLTVHKYFFNQGNCETTKGVVKMGNESSIAGNGILPSILIDDQSLVRVKSDLHFTAIKIAPTSFIDCEKSDSIFIAGMISNTGSLINYKAIVYEGALPSNIKKQNYNSLVIKRTGSDTLELKGNYQVENLTIDTGILKVGSITIRKIYLHEKSELLIGGASFKNSDFCSLKGKLKILKDYYQPTFNAILISPTGKFINNTTADFIFEGNITNNGEFIGCKNNNCIYTFPSDTCILSGVNKIRLPKIRGKHIINAGHLVINASVNCTSFQNLKAVEIAADSNQIVGLFDFSTLNNMVNFTSNTEQHLPIRFNKFQNLTFSGTSKKRIHSDISIAQNLQIKTQTNLETDSFQINGNSGGEIKIDSAATLELGHNLSTRPIKFPLNFKANNCLLHDSSTVKYQAKNSQFITAKIHYGNLRIDDGAVDSSFTSIIGDTLIINGNLTLEETSNFLLLENKYIFVAGNWNGPGNIHALNGTFEIHGDGNSYGKIIPNQSTFIYSGSKPQKLKPANYNLLLINSNSTVKTQANLGDLKAEQTNVIKGILDFNSEQVYINKLDIFDQVIFSSTYQEKTFNDIRIHSTGSLLLTIPEEIVINGNIRNDGTLNCTAGMFLLNNNSSPQEITGNGIFNFNQIQVNKEDQLLRLKTDVHLNDTLEIIIGNIILENSNIQLGQNGFIIGEDDTSQILGDEQSSLSFYREEVLDSIDSLGNLGLHLKNATHLSEIELIRTFEITNDILGMPSCRKRYALNWESDSSQSIEIKTDILQQELYNYKKSEIGLWASNNNDENHYLLPAHQENSYLINSQNSNWSLIFAPQDLTVLPVEIISFTASKENHQISTTWNTGMEINVEKYIVAQSRNLKIDSIATIDVNNLQNYELNFMDFKNSSSEILLFENRISPENLIAAQHLNGEEKRRKVWIKNQKLYIEPKPTSAYKVLELNGKEIAEDKLKNGIYIIQIMEGNKTISYKVLN